MGIALLVDADQWAPTSVYSLVRRAEASRGTRTRDAFGAFDAPGPQAPWRAHYERLGFSVHSRVGRGAADHALVERARSVAGAAAEVWVATRDRDLLAEVASAIGGTTARLVVIPDPEDTPPGAELRPIPLVREPPGSDLEGEVVDAIEELGGSDGEVLLSLLAPHVTVDARRYGHRSLRDALCESPRVFVRGGENGGEVVVGLRRAVE